MCLVRSNTVSQVEKFRMADFKVDRNVQGDRRQRSLNMPAPFKCIVKETNDTTRHMSHKQEASYDDSGEE